MSQNNVPGVTRINTYEHIDENDVSDLSNVKPFADSVEMTKAMQDPRYKTSPAYRQEVARRMMAGGTDNVRVIKY